jgi:hypothetical protein
MAERLLRRETRYGVWEQRRPLTGARYWFGTETRSYCELPRKWWTEAKRRSDSEAVKLHEHDGKAWWRYKGELFTGQANLSAADVTALAAQMQRSNDKAIERAHAELRGEEAAVHRREPIPESVRHEVWRRDQDDALIATPATSSSSTTSSRSAKADRTPHATSNCGARLATHASPTVSDRSG